MIGSAFARIPTPAQAPAVDIDRTLTFTGSLVMDLILVGGLIVSVFALVWLVKRM